MLPTPSKFHYIFNLRDLSRVFQGLFMCPAPDVIKTEEDLLALWMYECLRVFADRLVNKEDKAWLDDVVSATIRKSFGPDEEAEMERVMEDLQTPRFFVDFMRPALEDPETGEDLPAPKVSSAWGRLAIQGQLCLSPSSLRPTLPTLRCTSRSSMSVFSA